MIVRTKSASERGIHNQWFQVMVQAWFSFILNFWEFGRSMIFGFLVSGWGAITEFSFASIFIFSTSFSWILSTKWMFSRVFLVIVVVRQWAFDKSFHCRIRTAIKRGLRIGRFRVEKHIVKLNKYLFVLWEEVLVYATHIFDDVATS